MTRAEPAQDLPRHEWDFGSVPESELVACCYWEYARESAFIRDVKRRCEDPRCQQMTNAEVWKHCGQDLARIQSIGHASEVIVRGFFFRPTDKHPQRHPQAPGVTGRFPCPWQCLSAAERKERSGIRTDVSILQLQPFELAHWAWAKDLARHVESQARRMLAELPPDQGLKAIRPSIQLSNAETLLVNIHWGHFTNDQIATAFRRSLKRLRPQDMPEPDGRGHKPGDWRAQLTRLAVMRLLSRFTALQLVGSNQLPEIWQSKQFSGAKWGDITKWHDARREAGRVFHRLFPFLSSKEMPLSWHRARCQ